MIRLAVDEDFNGDIVRGVLRGNPALDVARVQDMGLSGADDDAVLAWAASEGRVLLTHDVSTMTRHAYARVDAGLPMAGVYEVSQALSPGRCNQRHPAVGGVQPRRRVGWSSALPAALA